MRIKFQQNLDDLKERLLIMAGLVEQAIQRAIESALTPISNVSAIRQ